jgi:alkylated DNA repair dioxygenase AlkB
MYAKLASHHMTGIKWAYDTFSMHTNEASLPPLLQERYDSFHIPFRIIPACLQEIPDLSVAQLVRQVDFQVDAIRTTSNQVVPERRQTAWEGDSDVPPFEYSGKSMPTRPWSPLVEAVRDGLLAKTGQYYNGCLLNLYPDGGSGMRYHTDPDQGVLWDSATAVVSVGSTRKFAFRDIPNDTCQKIPSQPHNFVVMEGDVTEMLDDCQMRFQHTVKTADDKNEMTPRASLVFKRTLTKGNAVTTD